MTVDRVCNRTVLTIGGLESGYPFIWIQKGHNDSFQVPFTHLSMSHSKPYPGEEFLQKCLHRKYGGHPIVNKEDLPPPPDLVHDHPGDGILIEGQHFRLNRVPIPGRCINDGNSPQA